jgi:carboxyl-terminal processing protease
MNGRSVLVGFALGVLAATGIGVIAGPSGQMTRSARAATGLDRKAFHGALDTVLDRYVDPVDRASLLARGLKHMVAGLDPHSHYMTASERKALRVRARGGRAGMWLAMRSADSGRRFVEVLGVEANSPAAKAGLTAGDHVLSIRDRDVALMLSQADAEALLVGRDGEVIALSVQKRNAPAPRPVALTLDDRTAPGVEGKLVAHNGGRVARVRIGAFRAGTGTRFKKTLRELRRAAGAPGLAGIVLDLRGNPGGEVDQALIVADLFVDAGVLTRTRGRGGQILREERAHSQGTDRTTPLVVLQDAHTASASELLAAALQAHGRAKVVGERSYGKGTVQQVTGMEDGSVLTLTIARYFSPDDRVIDKLGVKPDVVVHANPDDPADAMLDAALQALP